MPFLKLCKCCGHQHVYDELYAGYCLIGAVKLLKKSKRAGKKTKSRSKR